MMLKELFLELPEDYAVMSLPHNPPNKPNFDPIYSKVIGTQDGLDVWGSREKYGYDTVGFKDGDKVIAYAIYSENPTSGAHALRELWVDDTNRKKGLATALILFITRKVNIKLVLNADEIVSSSARKILIKMIQNFKVKAFTNDGTNPIDTLNSTDKTNTSVTFHESKSTSPLFGKSMTLADGRKTFQEHCLVINEGIYD